jgi:hypothetical protein
MRTRSPIHQTNRESLEIITKADENFENLTKLKLLTDSLKTQLHLKEREQREICAERDALKDVNEHRNHTINLLRNELAAALDDSKLLSEENDSLKKRVTPFSK